MSNTLYFESHFSTLYSIFDELEEPYLTNEIDNDVALIEIKEHINRSFLCICNDNELDIQIIYNTIKNIIKFCYYMDTPLDIIINNITNLTEVDNSFINLSDNIQYEYKQLKKSIIKNPETNIYDLINLKFMIPVFSSLTLLINKGYQIEGTEKFIENFEKYIN